MLANQIWRIGGSMKFLLLLFTTILYIHLSATIINIPEDYSTIQEGIVQAMIGDTILVNPGTYFENINFIGKDILLTSHFLFGEDPSYIDETIIDGSNPTNPDTTSTIVFCNNETEATIIQGFTITGGGGTVWIDPQLPALIWFSGGGIFMYYSSPTIRHNYIKENIVINSNNYDGASGGGLLCFRGDPTITNNIISLNQADYGAGVVVDYSGAIIQNNLIIENTGGQLYGGGGFYFIGNDTEPIIVENNTIAENHSETTGGAMRMMSSTITAQNNIIWNNTQISGGPIYYWGASTITFSNVEGGFTGEGNIDLDPQFIDEELYLLDENSPCIDAGNPDQTFNDPEDPNNPGQAQFPSQGTTLNDMGVYGGPLSACFQQTSIENNTIIHSVIEMWNYPNPFNPTTTIAYSIVEPGNITINVFNTKGQLITTLVNETREAGNYTVTWDGTDSNCNQVSSGIYFYRLQSGKKVINKKMMLLK